MKKQIAKLIIVITLLVVLASASIASAGGPGCVAVSGEIDQIGGPGGLSGTISGDIEGTVVTIGGDVTWHGVALFRPVEQTWVVTGGIVEPLIGRTLYFENDFIGIFGTAPIIVNTKARIIDGAERANLTLHGWTDLSAVPITNHLDYHGVICP